ncbi:tetratricopeptide repeat protein [Cobetia marina]|uniref:tetratricopeptide repeat protein n=1 Tax=Cobetia marina TaxID=28258 RepID=UPI0011426A45|nr:hypothetical protein [Cobetia marina]GED41177.1 hypothetical protein HHA02_05060 [Cobetia marina]
MNIRESVCRLGVLGVMVGWLAGCGSIDSMRESRPDAGDRLEYLNERYQQLMVQGRTCLELEDVASPMVDCQRLLREAERLHVEYPRNPEVLYFNALLSHAAGRGDKAQFFLDQMSIGPSHPPEAFVLRSQLALEEGNTTLARNVLERGMLLHPNYAGLYEGLAAVSYVEGRYDDAEQQLTLASRLGAPAWREEYHRGLINEAQGHLANASRQFDASLARRQDHQPARAHLLRLATAGHCRGDALKAAAGGMRISS